ncbi:MAG: metallophosphoesterase [Elusimicrobiota bacterium]
MIGIISDTHDNLPVISKAVDLFNERKVELVLHAGDFVSPFTVRAFKSLNAPMTGVFGNNDGDRETLIKFFEGVAEISAGWKKIELGDKKIILTHRPLPEVPQDCDLYIYGHTHEPVIENGSTIVVNPGECSGWLSGRCTVAIADLNKREAELIEL